MRPKAKTKQLLDQIEHSHAELEKLSKSDSYPHAVTGSRHVAQILSATAELAEMSTRRIIILTWFLAILTAALLVVEIRAVFFPKNSATPKQDVQASQNEQIAIPSVTNR
jgi:hypothetical protein